jgi:hypothetical protein
MSFAELQPRARVSRLLTKSPFAFLCRSGSSGVQCLQSGPGDGTLSRSKESFR